MLLDNALEDFADDAARYTFSLTLRQPFADRIVNLIDKLIAWRNDPSEERKVALLAALVIVETTTSAEAYENNLRAR